MSAKYTVIMKILVVLGITFGIITMFIDTESRLYFISNLLCALLLSGFTLMYIGSLVIPWTRRNKEMDESS